MNNDENFYSYLCEYRKAFPIDKFGRLGGMYSLADLPISGEKVMQRLGVVFARNEEERMYHVRDKEHPAWSFWVPYGDVDINLAIKSEYRVK